MRKRLIYAYILNLFHCWRILLDLDFEMTGGLFSETGSVDSSTERWMSLQLARVDGQREVLMSIGLEIEALIIFDEFLCLILGRLEGAELLFWCVFGWIRRLSTVLNDVGRGWAPISRARRLLLVNGGDPWVRKSKIGLAGEVPGEVSSTGWSFISSNPSGVEYWESRPSLSIASYSAKVKERKQRYKKSGEVLSLRAMGSQNVTSSHGVHDTSAQLTKSIEGIERPLNHLV